MSAYWDILTMVLPAAVLVCVAVKWPGIAVVSVLGYAAAATVLGCLAGRGALQALPLFTVMAVAGAAYVFRARPNVLRWPQRLAAWVLGLEALYLAFCAWMALGGLWSPVGVLFTAILVGTVLAAVLASRRAVTYHVVSTLSACMRQGIPLPWGLVAAATGQNDKRARVLARLERFLSQGMTVSDALRRAWRPCPGDVVATVQAAEPIDQLPEALQRLERDLLARSQQRRQTRPCPRWYPLVVVGILLMVVSTVGVFLVPAFSKIFREMGRNLPAPTLAATDFWMYFGRPVGTLVFLAAAVGVPVGIYTAFRARRADRPQPLAWLGDGIKWRLPVARWFERNRSMLQTVKVLSLCLRAGSTIDLAVAATLGLDVNRVFRKRLRRWYERVCRGEDPAAAARASGVGRSLAWAFDTRANPNNAPRALDVLESVYRSRYSFRLALLRMVGWPVVIVALALLVGWTVYCLYLPLIEISRAYVEGAMLP